MRANYYKESGSFNAIELILSVVAIAVSTLLLGYAYSLLTLAIPFIYANILIAIGFGMGIGIAVRIFLRIFKNRNTKHRFFLTIVAIFLASYFQWTSFVNFVLMDKIPNFKEYLFGIDWLIVNPVAFFQIIGEINQVGTWSIGDIPIHGWMLTLVWIMEFLIIALGAFLIVQKMNIIPFSEQFNKWYPKYTLQMEFKSIFANEKTEEALNENLLETLKNLENGQGARHSRIHLFFMPRENQQYLTIEKVTLDTNGKVNKSVEISNFKISTSEAQQIMNNYKTKRERFDVF